MGANSESTGDTAPKDAATASVTASRTGTKVLASIPKAAAVASGAGSPFAPVCATFRKYLKTKGLKFTPERAMVLDAVLTEEGLFDAEQVVENLKREGHRGSRATVYRTLTHLHDAGILKQVVFDTSQTYYEVITGGETHDYLVCIETGQVIEFHSEKLRQLRDEICREFGYSPVSHQLHIFGISPEGRQTEEETEDEGSPDE